MSTRLSYNTLLVSVFVICACSDFANELLADGSAFVDGTLIRVTVEWSQGTNPQQGTDFTVDFTDQSNPAIDLKNGDLEWRVESKLLSDGDPANIGSLTTTDSDNYEVTIAKSDASAGAANLGSAVLDPAGDNYASIEGGRISGDLTGTLSVVGDTSGDGGELTFTIDGDVTSTAAISVPVLKGLTIGGDIAGDLSIDLMKGATLNQVGAVGSTAMITIKDLADAGGSGSLAAFSTSVPGTFSGDMDLPGGVPTNQEVRVWGALSSTSSIDLHDSAVAGSLRLMGGGTGVVTGVSDVTGELRLVHLSSHQFSGTAYIDEVSSGLINTNNAAPIDGTVNISGDMAGDMTLVGDILSSGAVNIGGDLTGELQVGENLEGTIDVSGDVDGQVLVEKDLTGHGRILIDGLLSGDLTIGQATGSLTLIHILDGIGLHGDLIINDVEGDFDANGEINIGPAVSDPGNFPTVTFDGSIKVKKEQGGSGGGDLNGRIRVVGCHDTTDDLDICICGAANGTITILQTGCTNQVTYSCVSGCP